MIDFQFSWGVRRALILSLPLIGLLCCVPWPFTESSDSRLLGLPVWAAYAVGTTALFAALVALLIGRYWELSAGDKQNNTPDR